MLHSAVEAKACTMSSLSAMEETDPCSSTDLTGFLLKMSNLVTLPSPEPRSRYPWSVPAVLLTYARHLMPFFNFMSDW
jgi:hypothetical protein